MKLTDNQRNHHFSIMGYDFVLILTVLSLSIIGILFIYSSGITSTGQNVSNEYIKQILWCGTGFMIMLFVSFVDYRRIKLISIYIYLFLVFILFLTLFLGNIVNGARSWLGIGSLGIQPSEFSKLATILFLASYLEDNAKEVSSLKIFILAALIVAVPAILILMQPDLGTTLVFFPIFLVTLFIAGADLKHFLFVILTLLFTATFIMMNAWDLYLSESFLIFGRLFSDRIIILYILGGMLLLIFISLIGFLLFKKKVYFWILYFLFSSFLSYLFSLAALKVLKAYQLMRLVVFLNPQVDPRGSGWNIIQSVTAVGSGGISGKGFLKGTQSHYRFLPQQSTDFIFSIFAEETGFVGSVILFLLFTIILVRGMYIVTTAKDRFGALITTGIMGMFSFHIIENIGMAIGIMPVTGIPLLFLSYGGSSLWTAFLSIGIMLSIHQKRYRD